MKKVFVVLMSVSFLFMVLPAFSQQIAKSYETFVIDDFDNPDNQEYQYDGEKLSWSWTVKASRFIAEGYPKFDYFDGIPNSLRPIHNPEKDAKVFGVKTAFNRKGDNWFEIIPMQDGKIFEIPFTGNVDTIDFWVWGANYLYYLEVMVRDANGRVHVLPAGNMAHIGWRNAIIKIPTWMVQKSKLRSGPRSLTLVGFRIRTDGAEYVDDFAIYFDNLKYTSNQMNYIYDGFELRDTDFSNAQTDSSSSSTSDQSAAEAK